MSANGDPRAGSAGSVFFDTNVLLYGFDATNAEKRIRAQAWLEAAWAARRARASWQVIHEFYQNATGKLKQPTDRVRNAVESYLEWPLEPSGPVLLRRAWHWCDTAQVHFWDAMIVAAAEQSGARLLVSEDLQDGQSFGSVTVVNPFLHEPGEFGL